MTDIIVLMVLVAVIIPAVVYLVRAKKRGQTCIGCPSASKCAKCGHCSDKKM